MFTGNTSDKSEMHEMENTAMASLRLSLHFEGFSQPWTQTMPLAAHRSPVDGGGYEFPAHFNDVRADEFWVASSNTHGTGGDGNQLFAYDMVVQQWNPDANSNPELLPGVDDTENKHFRIWRKKLYAMADGLVLLCPREAAYR
jgi:hypothetical protein